MKKIYLTLMILISSIAASAQQKTYAIVKCTNSTITITGDVPEDLKTKKYTGGSYYLVDAINDLATYGFEVEDFSVATSQSQTSYQRANETEKHIYVMSRPKKADATVTQTKSYVIVDNSTSTLKILGDTPADFDKSTIKETADAINALATYGYMLDKMRCSISQSQLNSTIFSNNIEIYLLSREVNSSNVAGKLRGDVNEDGRVSISDVNEVVDILLNAKDK